MTVITDSLAKGLVKREKRESHDRYMRYLDNVRTTKKFRKRLPWLKHKVRELEYIFKDRILSKSVDIDGSRSTAIFNVLDEDAEYEQLFAISVLLKARKGDLDILDWPYMGVTAHVRQRMIQGGLTSMNAMIREVLRPCFCAITPLNPVTAPKELMIAVRVGVVAVRMEADEKIAYLTTFVPSTSFGLSGSKFSYAWDLHQQSNLEALIYDPRRRAQVQG